MTVSTRAAVQVRPLSTAQLVALAFATFTVGVGYGVLLPILPDVVARALATDDAARVAWHVGWLTGSFVGAPILFAPLWGRVSDRLGRRPVLLIALLGFAATSVAPSSIGIGALYAMRLANGAFAAAAAPAALAAVADFAPSAEARARGFAAIGMAAVAGYFVGPVLGWAAALLTPFGSAPAELWRPLAVAAVLTLTALPPLLILPPGCPPISPASEPSGWGLSASLTNSLIVMASIAAAAVAAFEVAMTMHTRSLGLGAGRLSVIFAECSLVMLAAQAIVLWRMWEPRLTHRLIAPAFAAMAVGLALAPVSTGFPASMIVTGAVAAGGGLLTPILAYWISLASNGERGFEQGRRSAAISLGQWLGAVGAGSLIGRSGASEAPFFVAAGIVAMAALVAAMLQRRIAGPTGLAPPSQTTASQEQARSLRARA